MMLDLGVASRSITTLSGVVLTFLSEPSCCLMYAASGTARPGSFNSAFVVNAR